MPRTAHVRRVKGMNLIGLVKIIKGLRKHRAIVGLSPAAEGFLASHVLVSDWYDFAPFMELVEVVYRELLGRDEQKALEMGITGGKLALSGNHKHFIKVGDPMASLLAMRHTWRVYFDFGELEVRASGPRSVRFAVDGYTDMSAAHGMLIVGWHVAAALEAGSPTARSTLIEAPWLGSESLVHDVVY